MLRTLVGAVLALGLSAGVALSADKDKSQGKDQAPKIKSYVGSIKAVDPERGIVTVTVTSEGAQKDHKFQLDDVTRIVIYSGARPIYSRAHVLPVTKEMVKENRLGVRSYLKEGTQVLVIMAGDKVMDLKVNPPPEELKSRPGQK